MKYNYPKVPGDLNSRTEVVSMHRKNVHGTIFISKYKLVMLNQRVSRRLQSKLIYASIFPTTMFGLVSLPLPQNCFRKFDLVQ